MGRSLRTHLCVVSLLGQEGEEGVRIEEAFVLAFWSDLPLLWPYRSYLLVQIGLVLIDGDHLLEMIAECVSAS
jgi:hypothetical protein